MVSRWRWPATAALSSTRFCWKSGRTPSWPPVATGPATSAATKATSRATMPESGQPLTDGSRFATQAIISLQSADAGGGPVTNTLAIDGTKAVSIPATIATVGGHSLVATASDLAGNQARVDRTLFIGSSS